VHPNAAGSNAALENATLRIVHPIVAMAIDGDVRPTHDAAISLLDRTVSLGDGLFETLLVVQSTCVDVHGHWLRVSASAHALGLRLPTFEQLQRTSSTVIAAARATGVASNLRMKWLFTRGESGWPTLSEPQLVTSNGHWFVHVAVASPPPLGIKLARVDWPLPQRHQPLHKSTSYADSLQAKYLAMQVGADEAIRFDWRGCVAEGAAVNIFAVSNRVIFTAATPGILPGIVRGRVLQLAQSCGYPVVERGLAWDEFVAAEEWFVTNTMIGICPVRTVDSISMPDNSNQKSSATAAIASAYASYVVAQIPGR
jgi:branched-subunit amino acid aminotransferase/4-amino-4-deoxychorismate lyase